MERSQQRDIDSLMLEHLKVRGGAWVTAREVAMEVGYPWRVVARTLMRLAHNTHIEQARHELRSRKHRTRDCYIYRQVTTAHAEFPAWLMPRSTK